MVKLSKDMKIDIRNIINSNIELSGEIKRVFQSALDVDESNQYKLVEAFANGCYGTSQNPEVLRKLAEFNWGESRKYVVEGYTNGSYGFSQNPDELKKVAELDWPKARSYVVLGYWCEIFGFKRNPEEVLRLADLDWPLARNNVIFALENPDKYHEVDRPGYNGFKRDPEKAKELRKKWGL